MARAGSSASGRTRSGRVQKALALVPLTVLSAAWTASIATTGAGTALAGADPTPAPALPDGTTLPSTALEEPASVSASGGVAPGVRGDARQVVATASASGIPAAALAAYQRAETVINAADPSCNLTWQLIAAIGRVESDHGRTGGNTLDAAGVADPGIFGPPLNGSRGTSRITDSDAGQYDGDRTWDRAVGPMQFIPSTWSVVGVDADGDGVRNPQDVDDAALATAVYLCSGGEDLSTVAGQRAAVHRYNHSRSYVDLVLSVMAAYLDGEFTSVPNGVTSAGYVVPAVPGTAPRGDRDPGSVRGSKPGGRDPGRGNGGQGNGGKGDGGKGSTGGQPTAPQPSEPSAPPSGPSSPTTPKPGPQLPTLTLPPLPSTSVQPVDQLLSQVQARAQCLLDGYVDNILRDDDPYDRCVYNYTH